MTLDSATALARTALFAQLSRVELASLAGELEELRVPAGQVVVREGDPGDALYVIKSGVAELRGHDLAADDARRRVMRPGEEFGEMALLVGRPRSATVAARTDLEVWRLPADRFRALLAQDRSLAISLARALSERLQASTDESRELSRRAIAMTALAGALLPPDAAALLARLGVAPAWPADVVDRVCGLFGQTAALAELRGVDGVFARADDVVAVDPVLADLFAGRLGPADRPWLLAAVEALRERGEPATAFRVAVAAGAADKALAILAERRPAVLAALGRRTVAAHLDGLPSANAAHAAAVATAIERLRREAADERCDEPNPSAQAAGWLREAQRAGERAGFAGGLARPLGSRRLAGGAIALGLYALGWLVAPPAGLDRAGTVAVAAIAATALLLVLGTLPDYAVGLALIVALVGPGVVPPEVALGGFASPSWVTLVALLAIGAAVARSGLLFRAALWSLERLGGNFVVQSLGLSAVGIVLSAGVTNGAPRVVLAVPAARGITDALRRRPGSREAAALALVTYLAFGELTALFVTSSTAALLLQGLLPEPTRSELGWGGWFVAGLFPNLLLFALGYVALLLLFRPALRHAVDARRVRVQRQVLGAVTRDEAVSGLALLVLVLGFATESHHGIGAAWIAVAVLIALAAAGALDASTFQSGVGWGLAVYMGALLALGRIVGSLGIDRWIASGLGAGMRSPLVGGPYGFVAAVAVAAILLHFLMPLASASPIIALVAMPLAIDAGYSPLVPALVCLIAGDHAALPYTNSGYLTLQVASGGDLVSEAQARPYRLLGPLLRGLAVLASVPYWQSLGLL